MHSACRTRKRREPGLRITSRRVASASRSALGWRAAARGQSRVKLSGWLCLCQSVSRMATSHGRRMTAEQRAKRQQVSFAANEIHVHVQQSSRGCQASRISSCLSVRVSAKESFAKRCNRSLEGAVLPRAYQPQILIIWSADCLARRARYWKAPRMAKTSECTACACRCGDLLASFERKDAPHIHCNKDQHSSLGKALDSLGRQEPFTLGRDTGMKGEIAIWQHFVVR